MNRRWLAPKVLLFGVIAMGCAGGPTDILPRHRDLSGYPTALLTATLVRTGECVLAQPEIGAPELPIWPATFSLVGDELRRQGVLVARIGDTVKLGGGEYKWEQRDFLAGLLVAPIPAACDRGPYWMVSELER